MDPAAARQPPDRYRLQRARPFVNLTRMRGCRTGLNSAPNPERIRGNSLEVKRFAPFHLEQIRENPFVAFVNFYKKNVFVVNPARARVWLVLTVALAALAYVVASFCLMVLTWDGAGYVFNSIQRGHPAVPNCRYSDYPFLAVVSLLGFLINDSRLLACIYGLGLAVLPLGSLLLSFHFLSSPQLKALRVWPVLGIFLSVLPGQGFLVAEAVPVTQVSWAV